MIPKTKSQNELIDDMISKKIEEPLKNISTDLGTKLDEISAKFVPKPKEERIEDIIKKMKDKVPERIIKKEPDKVPERIIKKEPDKELVKEPVKEPVKELVKELIKEPEHVHDDIFCPSCQKGHIHKMESSGLKMKCTDGTCGEEFFVIPKSADHSCSNCGFPIKKPEDETKIDACPFCKNTLANPFSNGKPSIKFDFTKMKK